MADIEKVIKGLEHCVYWEKTRDCTSCQYYPYRDGHDGCANQMKKDAIVLLKEQEPKVLTLEEVEERMNTNDDCDSIFYAEVRTLTRTSFGVFQLLFDNSEAYYIAVLLGSSFPAWYRKERYGYSWRCWNLKPNSEQRKAVPWDYDVRDK